MVLTFLNSDLTRLEMQGWREREGWKGGKNERSSWLEGLVVLREVLGSPSLLIWSRPCCQVAFVDLEFHRTSECSIWAHLAIQHL